MNLVFIGIVGIRLAFAGLSDTLVNVVVSASRQPIASQRVTFSVHQANVSSDRLMNTPQLFTRVSGVFLQRTNQGGGSAFVRGLTGNQTLLVLDGIRFNNSTFRYGPNQYLNTIDPFALDRVEVLKGSGSVQYGSDALTGAVSLSSQKPAFSTQSKWSGQLLTRGISQGMELSGLGKVSYQSDKYAISILAGKKKFGDITRGGDGAFQRPTGYAEQNLQMQYRQKISDHVIWENLVQQNSQDHVPVFHKVKLENYAINEMTLQAYRRAFSRLFIAGAHPWNRQLELTASYQQSIEKRTLQKNASQTTRSEEDHVKTWGFIGQLKSVWTPTLSSMTGLEYYADGVTSLRTDQSSSKIMQLRGLYPNGASYQTISAFSIHEWELQQWQLHAGLRYQQAIAALPDTTVGNANLSIGALVYDLGISYALSQHVTLFSSVSSGFRSPNLDDLGSLGIVDFRYELPAYQLKPEYSWTKNAGIRVQTAHWKMELASFHTQLANLITRIKTTQLIQNYPVYRKENVDKAYIYGFEWKQQLKLGARLDLVSSMSYTYGQNESQKEPMRRIPPLHGNIALMYALDKGNVGIVWQVAGSQDRLSAGDKSDNRMNPNGTPGWGIVNLQASYKISPHIQLGMQGENLGNVRYRMHGSGMDGMGRSLHMQIGYLW